MTALILIAGIIVILYAVPSPQPRTVITINKTTHMHVHVDVKVLSLPSPASPEAEPKAFQTLVARSIPAGTAGCADTKRLNAAIERYRAPQFQAAERKLLA